MSFSDLEFRQLENIVYYVGTWNDEFNNLIHQKKIPFEIRTFIYSCDDDDVNIVYSPELDNLKKIYRLIKKNCIKPKYRLYLKHNNKINQP